MEHASWMQCSCAKRPPDLTARRAGRRRALQRDAELKMHSCRLNFLHQVIPLLAAGLYETLLPPFMLAGLAGHDAVYAESATFENLRCQLTAENQSTLLHSCQGPSAASCQLWACSGFGCSSEHHAKRRTLSQGFYLACDAALSMQCGEGPRLLRVGRLHPPASTIKKYPTSALAMFPETSLDMRGWSASATLLSTVSKQSSTRQI